MSDQAPHEPEDAAARARQRARAYRERNKERLKAYKAQWRAENPEKHREHVRRSAQRKKDLAARAASRRASQQKWEAANRDHVREYRAQWRAANLDKVRAQQRASYARRKDAVAQRSREDRDRHPDKYAANLERAKLWRKNNPEKVAEYARERRKDPEKYAQQLRANREAKRLQRRLAALNLPAPIKHRASAAEKRTNERNANVFFTSAQARTWHHQYAILHQELHRILTTEHHALREAAARANAARQRAGLPAADVATAISARAVERVLDDGARATALTSADIARAVQSVHAQMLREQKQQQGQSLRAALRLRVRRNTAALIREAEIENTARAQVGKARLPLDLAAHIIAFHQLKDQLPTDLLTQKDADRVIAHVREQNLSLFVEDTGPTRVGPELDGPTLTR